MRPSVGSFWTERFLTSYPPTVLKNQETSIQQGEDHENVTGPGNSTDADDETASNTEDATQETSTATDWYETAESHRVWSLEK